MEAVSCHEAVVGCEAVQDTGCTANKFPTQASGNDSSNLSLLMIRMNENVLEDSVQGLVHLYKGEYQRLRQEVNSKGFKEKWTLGGNPMFDKTRLFVFSRIVCLGSF